MECVCSSAGAKMPVFLVYFLLVSFSYQSDVNNLEDDVAFEIVPDFIMLQPGQTEFSYKVDCRVENNFRTISSISILHELTDGTLEQKETENSTVATGLFEEADVDANLNINQSTPYITAKFSHANASCHYGTFMCEVNGTRTNESSHEIVTKSAVLHYMGTPIVEVNRKGQNIVVTCGITAAYVSHISMEFFQDGYSFANIRNMEPNNTDCSLISDEYKQVISLRSDGPRDVMHLQCVSTYMSSDGTTFKTASETETAYIDDVTFAIEPNFIMLKPEQTYFSYKIDCSVSDEYTSVSSITIIHSLTSAQLGLKDDENSIVATGFFEDSVVDADLKTNKSSAHITAMFNQAIPSIHYGSFKCQVNGTRIDSPSNVSFTRSAELRFTGTPVLEANRLGKTVEVTCRTTSACVRQVSLKTFKEEQLVVMENTELKLSNCSYKSEHLKYIYNLTSKDIGRNLQFSCSSEFMLSNGTRYEMSSVTETIAIGYTYGKPCNNSEMCLGQEICIEDDCGSQKCLCGPLFFYNTSGCEKKKGFGEMCSNTDQCSTWLSVCNTAYKNPNCTCRDGEMYNKTTDSCTNIVPCPGQLKYIHFTEERSCYKIAPSTASSTNWKDTCTEQNSVPLHLTSSLRDHMVKRLWNLGFYTRTLYSDVSLQDRLQIILSTNYSKGKVWSWPDGKIVSLDKSISYPPDWPNEAAGNNNSRTCLYMVYDGPRSGYEASRDCNFSASYKGCFIQLPKAYCQASVDIRNNTWNYTEGGTVLNKTCPDGYRGKITRECGINGIFKPAFYNCTLVVFDNIKESLANGTIEPKEALEQMKDVTKNKSEEMNIGDLVASTNILATVTTKLENVKITENVTNDFLDTVSVLVDSNKTGSEWKSRVEQEGKGAENVMAVVDNFMKKASESLMETNQTFVNVKKPGLVVEISKIEKNPEKAKDFVFPRVVDKNETQERKTPISSFHLPQKAIEGADVGAISVVLYEDLSSSIPTALDDQPKATKTEINSQVISVQMLPAAPRVLNPEIVFSFNPFQNISNSVPHCTSWQLNASGIGRWTTEGCRVIFSNDTLVKCGCSHLTNFALLISPYVPPPVHSKVLGIITIVGCSISAAALVITILLHAIHWRALKSDKTIVTMCLCVTLLVGNLLFISAVSNIEDQAGCTALAIILHYIFLVVFFLMFAEGVNVFIAIVFVFHKKSHLIQLLAGAFGIPVLLVAISMGATKLEGYGSHGSCWLSRENGLFWAFAAPAVIIIVLNYVIIVVLFRTMYKTTSFVDKTAAEKAKTTAMALAVISPVTGITWIVGIFSVDENTIWLQYVFCIFNSLQGVLIFVFHCVRNRQLHQAMKAQRKRKESIQGFDSEFSSIASISGISKSIRKRFAGLLAFKNRSYDIMSVDDRSTSGASSVQYQSKTEQSEIMSETEPSKKKKTKGGEVILLHKIDADETDVPLKNDKETGNDAIKEFEATFSNPTSADKKEDRNDSEKDDLTTEKSKSGDTDAETTTEELKEYKTYKNLLLKQTAEDSLLDENTVTSESKPKLELKL